MSHTTPGFPGNSDIAKAQAKRLRIALEPDHNVGHSQSLELLARLHGEQSWGRMNSLFSMAEPQDTGTLAATTVPTPTIPKGNAARLPDSHIEQRALKALYKGLKKARLTTVTAKARLRAKKLTRDGIISTQGFETWLDELDVNLGGMVFDMHIDNLIKILGIQTTSRYQRPVARENGAYAFPGVRLAGFAEALIRLNHFGFDTHPEVFVEPLLDDIKKSRYIDGSELTCFWYGQSSKKFTFHESFIDALTQISDLERENFTMRNGTNVSIEHELGGRGLIHRITLSR